MPQNTFDDKSTLVQVMRAIRLQVISWANADKIYVAIWWQFGTMGYVRNLSEFVVHIR